MQNRVTVLCLDTALAACTVGVVQQGKIVAAKQELRARGHAERLIPMVQEVLLEAGQPVVTAIVCTLGPGSFTGLRVALSAAQAFGLAWNCPVYGVSTLQAVAYAARETGTEKILVAHDAGRGQCYGQLFAADATALSGIETGDADQMDHWAIKYQARLFGTGVDRGAAEADPYPAVSAMSAMVAAGLGSETLAPLYGTSWSAPPA
jgi:tRNA threonylcarbamoyl adenosine modification protein YeaZ